MFVSAWLLCKPRVVVLLQHCDQTLLQVLSYFSVSAILRNVVHVVRILLQIIKLFSRSLAKGKVVERLHIKLLSVRNKPCLGWASVHIT